MLETDTQLDDFKDDMIEVTEEDMKKLSGAGPDPDGDAGKDDDKDSEKKSEKASDKKAETKKKVEETAKKVEAEKKSMAGTIVKVLIALAAIGGLVAVFVFTGLKNDIVGKWEYVPENNSNVRMVFEFKDDGVVEARSYMNNLLNFYDKGTYTTKSGYLSCNWEGQGEVSEVEYEVKDDKLTFVKKGQVFTRIKDDNASNTDAN